MSAARCPACGGDRTPLWWSKAGMTYRLCDACKDIARSQRRLQYEFKRLRDGALTLVRMDGKQSPRGGVSPSGKERP